MKATYKRSRSIFRSIIEDAGETELGGRLRSVVVGGRAGRQADAEETGGFDADLSGDTAIRTYILSFSVVRRRWYFLRLIHLTRAAAFSNPDARRLPVVRSARDRSHGRDGWWMIKPQVSNSTLAFDA